MTPALQDFRRVVLKVGSALLVDPSRGRLRHAWLAALAEDIAEMLRGLWNIDYDTSGAIGRRYRRQDEIGTPFCVTVDFDSLEDKAVTVRERDTMAQERISIDELVTYLAGQLAGC